MIRLVASDIDGTLLQGGARALSDELFGLIRVLKKRGILFCAASGRQYRSMRALFAQAEDDIAYLCENGAIVYRGGSVVSKLAMERADALARTPAICSPSIRIMWTISAILWAITLRG